MFAKSYTSIRSITSAQASIVYAQLEYMQSQQGTLITISYNCLAKQLKMTLAQVRYAIAKLEKARLITSRIIRRVYSFVKQYTISCASHVLKLTSARAKNSTYIKKDVKDNVNVSVICKNKSDERVPIPPPKEKMSLEEKLESELKRLGKTHLKAEVEAHVSHLAQTKGWKRIDALKGAIKLIQSGLWTTPKCMYSEGEKSSSASFKCDGTRVIPPVEQSTAYLNDLESTPVAPPEVALAAIRKMRQMM